MCGIVTIINKKNNFLSGKIVQAFKEMMYGVALRGFDSTGIANVGNKVFFIKDNVNSLAFFKAHINTDWDKNQPILMGHCRAATKGKTSPENAHPFNEGKITLIHNGTLDFHRTLKNVDVDSHAICHALNETKNKKETIENLSGAFALIWYNEEEKILYAIRNTERPLYYVETEDHIILISELGLATWILNRNNIKLITSFQIKENDLYAFKYVDNKLITTKQKYSLEKKEVYQQNFDYYNFYTKDSPKTEIIVSLDSYEELNYKAYGTCSFTYFGRDYYTNTPVEVYSPTNNLDIKNGLFKVEKKYTLVKEKQNTFVCIFISELSQKEYFELLDEEEEIKAVSFDDTLLTKNGVPLNSETLKLAAGSNCISCGSPFVYSTEIKLIPVIKKNHVYKYNYYCPDCAKK